MCTRVLLRRLGFAHAIRCSRWRLGTRSKLVDFFDDECEHLAGFDAVSVMGATRRAIQEGARLTEEGMLDDGDKKVITEQWPDYTTEDKISWRSSSRRAASWGESSWREREVWSEDTGAASAALLRAMRPTREWLRWAVLSANSGHPRAVLVAVLVGAWWAAPLVRLITPAGAVDRGDEEKDTELDPGGDDNDDDSDSEDSDDDSRDDDSAIDNDHHDDGSGFADDGDAHLDTRAGDRGFGRAPAATAATGDDGDGGDGGTVWSADPAHCPACGLTSTALDVHVICGAVHGERPCAGVGGRCSGIPAVRGEFQRRVKELFDLAGCNERLTSTPAGTHKYLALLLGGARGIPGVLSAELADAFEETWGRWSQKQRLDGKS
jgi:hypothetical protein